MENKENKVVVLEPPKANNMNKWILWILLVVAVVVLGILVWKWQKPSAKTFGLETGLEPAKGGAEMALQMLRGGFF
jgi:cytochrome c-type biogenesis protein CcmH/NrfF